MYNVRESGVHLTEAGPIGFVQNVHCLMWTFWGYDVQPMSRCFKPNGSEHCVCNILSGLNALKYLYLYFNKDRDGNFPIDGYIWAIVVTHIMLHIFGSVK